MVDPPPDAAAHPRADPVELELFHHRFASVAEQMGATLRRTALSTNVKERLDFSCALFDARGSLVANAAHIPVHLGAMEECVRCLLADVPDMRPGEAYVTNDPFRGGSHLPDVTVVTPVFAGGHDTARPRFFIASRAHHAEIGGITPGSLPPDARTLAEEGVLIRAFRYRSDEPGASDAALRALLLAGPHPTRSVEENLADIHAQLAANQAGAALSLTELVSRHGLRTPSKRTPRTCTAPRRHGCAPRSRACRRAPGASATRWTTARRFAWPSRRMRTGRRGLRFHRQRPGASGQPQRQPGHRRQRGDLLPALPPGRTRPA